MKVSRGTLILAGLFLLLLLATGLAALLRASPPELPAYSSRSGAADGVLALREWLPAAGYPLTGLTGDSYAISPDTKGVFILEPDTDDITAGEWGTLEDWVRQGGALLLAAEDWEVAFPDNPFHLTFNYVIRNEMTVYPLAPIFRSPDFKQPAHLTIHQTLDYSGAEGAVLLTVPDGPVAWQIRLGRGQVIALADASFLTNVGLKDPGNAALAINLISQIPPGSGVYLDEWHHGERSAAATGSGPGDWLTQTPGGFAVLFTAGVIFLGLVLAGRPFGRRIPLARSGTRRGALDYVNALANLNRRAGHRQQVMAYYYAELKRSFGQRYRLDPELPDSELIAQVTQANPALAGASLGNLLRSLQQKQFNEREMVDLARECADWMARNAR